MQFIKSWSVILLAVLLSACAASGPKFTEVKSTIPALKKDQGRVYFYRDASMFGAAIQPNIQLNGTVVGESVPGSFFFVDRAPGAMKVATSTEVEKALTFTLEAGQTRYVKTSVSFGLVAGRVQPELVDSATAQKEMEALSYTGAAFSGQK